MSVSKHLLILPLGLLIAVSGCSSNRLRQIFAPDREFMSLSEINGEEAKREQSAQSSHSLASQSGTVNDESNGGGNDGFFSVSRWLNPKDSESYPPDPFLEYDEADQTAVENPVIAVAHSNETGVEDNIEFPDKDNHADQRFVEETSGLGASADNNRVPTFADILAEFEFEDDTANNDDLDDFAREWLADEVSGEDVNDFDVLMANAMEDADATRGSGDSEVTLRFDAEDEEQFVGDRQEQPEAADIEGGSWDFEALSKNGDELTVDEPSTRQQSDPFDTSLVFDHDEALDESLWQSSDSVIGWQGSDTVEAEARDEPVPTEPLSNKELPEFSEPTKLATAARMRPTNTPPNAVTQPAGKADHRRTARPSRLTQTREAPVRRSTVAGADPQFSHSDPFLTEVEPQPLPAANPEVESEALVGSSFSPRTWLMLLGAVAIAYLLFAPERKNLHHLNNR